MSEYVPTRREQARERDRRLAELLGWKRLDPPTSLGHVSYEWQTPDGDLCFLYGPPAYSTDPAAMLALLEAMRGRGERVRHRFGVELGDRLVSYGFNAVPRVEWWAALSPELVAEVALAALEGA